MGGHPNSYLIGFVALRRTAILLYLFHLRFLVPKPLIGWMKEMELSWPK